MPYVYRHIRLDKNEPFYIGVGSDLLYKRANTKHGRNDYWKRIVAKTEYEVEILIDNIPFDAALEKEKEFIKLYGRKDTGTGILCNMTDGGDGVVGNIVSEKSKKLMSDKKLGCITWNKGKKAPEISEGKRGFKQSDETKIKMSNSRKGRFSGFDHAFSMIVLNKETGIFYGSSNEAAKAHNINPRTMRAWLTGQNPNKSSFIKI